MAEIQFLVTKSCYAIWVRLALDSRFTHDNVALRRIENSRTFTRTQHIQMIS